MNSKAKEPSTAPPAEQWFPITLGSTFRDPSPSARFYSLRYEFKPASIDTTRPGSLFKSTDNKVTVEFCNNQAGKPKVSFQGNSEECKELDGVVFFDGKSFRLERLHRAVKSLRHMRQPGESVAGNISSSVGGSGIAGGSAIDSTSPVHPNGTGPSIPAANVSVEKIDSVVHVEEISSGQPDVSADKKANNKRKPEVPVKTPKGRISPPVESSPVATKPVQEEQVDIDDDIDDKGKKQKTPEPAQPEVNIDDEIISDYEIEDVDVSEDEDGVNAAEALRAQAAISQKQEQSSSESSGSGSGSGSGSDSSDSGSGSGSGSSSSGSGSDDDEDSATSVDDI